jgi:hypothetical protein
VTKASKVAMAVVAAVILVSVGALAANYFGDDSLTTASSSDEYSGGSSSASPPDTNSYLDRLWEDCADGDFAACDDLFLEAPSGSEYKDFGDSCGNRNEPAGYCETIYGSGGGSSSASPSDTNSYLDRLWQECADGDFASCDELYLEAPYGSAYEDFGDSCGNRNEPAGYCEDIYW